MRKFFKALHKWLSIPAGLIITITCLTGAILVFQTEMLELAYPSRYFVSEVKDTPIPLAELIPMVNKQMDGNSVANVRVSADPERTYTMQQAAGEKLMVAVDPYTGEITDTYPFRGGFFHEVMKIHRWLMDGSRTVGKYAVGVTTLLLVFIIVSGAVIWFPRNRKQWKKAFTIKFKGGGRRLFYDLHRVLGVYVSIIILLCALTGLMWSFEWYRNGVFKLFGAEQSESRGGSHGQQAQQGGGQGRGNRGGQENKKEELDILHWDAVVAAIKEKNPTFEYIRIADKSASVHLKDAVNSRATDTYNFNPQTGEITKITYYSQISKSTRIFHWAYVLHVGNYWGMFSKIFTFIAALIGASLPVTGYYIFYVKRKKHPKTVRPVDG
ncbi:PepSY domain-containing protein [Dysgonomonas sp. 25]|uniref:PepSY-associated TM helix domain-containing protein n=1 Tax=Dysgonomonas sp. 25 TaxID=2302933 RepID=UPI0013D8D626|nr:PepSY-associated TM helix domain-containing protein [Dysgonomonas sp. 25]NDV69850.1 PepSY domain-containing protein [Dysgonomonas sp. 25]